MNSKMRIIKLNAVTCVVYIGRLCHVSASSNDKPSVKENTKSVF